MATALDLQPGDELLDVACGEGAFLVERASNVGHVAGIDLAPAKVGLARKRLADRIAAGTAEIVEGDAEALPWPSGTFSVVTCMDALSLLPDPQQALSEMGRVLRSGGRVVVQVGWRVPDGASTRRRLGTFWAWDEAEARRMTEAAGLGDVAISYARIGGHNRLGNALARLVMGTDEIRIVAATRNGGT
jgi:SAM-dependent methyltransferase